jgi:AraC family transcriptional regulator
MEEPQPKSNRAVYDCSMNERTTRSDYAIRLERVFTWLVDHLDEVLDLGRLADVACMSPYHFHRIYHAMQGETVTDTVRRLRLSS